MSFIILYSEGLMQRYCHMTKPQQYTTKDPRSWLNIKMLSDKYRNSHYKDKMVVRLFNLEMEIPTLVRWLFILTDPLVLIIRMDSIHFLLGFFKGYI